MFRSQSMPRCCSLRVFCRHGSRRTSGIYALIVLAAFALWSIMSADVRNHLPVRGTQWFYRQVALGEDHNRDDHVAAVSGDVLRDGLPGSSYTSVDTQNTVAGSSEAIGDNFSSSGTDSSGVMRSGAVAESADSQGNQRRKSLSSQRRRKPLHPADASIPSWIDMVFNLSDSASIPTATRNDTGMEVADPADAKQARAILSTLLGDKDTVAKHCLLRETEIERALCAAEDIGLREWFASEREKQSPSAYERFCKTKVARETFNCLRYDLNHTAVCESLGGRGLVGNRTTEATKSMCRKHLDHWWESGNPIIPRFAFHTQRLRKKWTFGGKNPYSRSGEVYDPHLPGVPFANIFCPNVPRDEMDMRKFFRAGMSMIDTMHKDVSLPKKLIRRARELNLATCSCASVRDVPDRPCYISFKCPIPGLSPEECSCHSARLQFDPELGNVLGEHRPIKILAPKSWAKTWTIKHCDVPCEFTSVKTAAHAIVASGPDTGCHARPYRFTPDQYTVFMCAESRAQTPHPHEQKFDIFSTYEKRSHVPFTEVLLHTVGPCTYNMYFRPITMAYKDRVIASKPDGGGNVVFISRNSRSFRDRILRKLMTMVDIHSIGKCLNNRPWPKTPPMKGGPVSYWFQKELTLDYYKANTALEGSRTPHLMTEKFFDPILSGAIPIWYGSDSTDMAHPGGDVGVIRMRDFASLSDLASHVNSVLGDEKKYNRMHEWRKHGPNPRWIMENMANFKGNAMCGVCREVARRIKHGVKPKDIPLNPVS